MSWADGDDTDRRIVVPISSNPGVVEDPESFALTLDDVQGGAGLGTRRASVNIAPDGDPAGQISIAADQPRFNEGQLVAHVSLFRNYYDHGSVTVTVTPGSDTATAGQDFDATPLTVTWADGDSSSKQLDIPLIDDDVREEQESFRVELSNPTGGALIGKSSSTTVFIADNELPEPPAGGGGGGGGWTGLLTTLLLGALGSLRRLMQRLRAPGREDSTARQWTAASQLQCGNGPRQ